MGVPLLDLISEGNIGLMKAVERYKADRGTSLAVYASFWIKQRIRLALANHSRTIRVPVHVHEKLFQVRRAAAQLRDVLGREPSEEEISQAMRIGGVIAGPLGAVVGTAVGATSRRVPGNRTAKAELRKPKQKLRAKPAPTPTSPETAS